MDIFKNNQFLKLWGNQILLQIAFNMANFTALLTIDHLTDSRFALAQFYAVMTFPALLVGLFAGSIVDLSNRKKLMLITDAVLTVLFFLYAVALHQVWFILIIAFASASAAQFFIPAEAATIPIIVKENELERANGVFLFTALGSVLLGYAIAGPLIQFFGGVEQNGPRMTFIVASFLTGLGFFLRLSLHTIETSRPTDLHKMIFMKAVSLTKEILILTRKSPKIYLPITLLTLIEFTIGMLAILFIGYVEKYLGLPSTSTSYFFILPLIAGLIIGMTSMGYLEKLWKRGKLISFSILAIGFIIGGLGVAALTLKSFEMGIFLLRLTTAAAAAIIGAAMVFISVPSRTSLQENSPRSMLGRVFSLVTISASAMTPIPVLIISLTTERLDVAIILTGLGIFLMAIGLVLTPHLNKYFD